MTARPRKRRPLSHRGIAALAARILPCVAAVALAACATSSGEMEVSKDTFGCKLQGQRIVVRFTEQEARILMPPDEHLVTLYQVSTQNGVRYTNGLMELRGSTSDLTLIRENVAVGLTDCEPLKVPKKSTNPFMLN
jgi:membrane-bound inhibitor of C-type lysozyme